MSNHTEVLRKRLKDSFGAGLEKKGVRLVPGAQQRAHAQLHLSGTGPERARLAGEFMRPFVGDLIRQFLVECIPSLPVRHLLLLGLKAMYKRLPEPMRCELGPFAKAAGIAPQLAVVMSILGDMHAAAACSTVVASPPLTRPNSLIFGRNLDFFGAQFSTSSALLTVHHPPTGSAEIPTANLGWAGLWGTHTGWNAAGLCLGNMQVYNAPRRIPQGPLALRSRRWPASWIYTHILRTCRTVDEALGQIESIRPLSPNNLMLADASGDAALIEWDLDCHGVRRTQDGLLCATNYFVEPRMPSTACECWRLQRIKAWADATGQNSGSGRRPVDAVKVQALLDDVNQGELTLHSVVFEPQANRVHIATSEPPSSHGPWWTHDLDVWSCQAT